MPQRNQRVRALASARQFRVGGLLIQPDRLLAVGEDGTVALEPRMMEVLVALAERAGEVVSAEQLLIEVWRGTFYGDNPVHKTMAQLRRRLGDDSRAPRYIETIRKRGYRLIARVAFPDDYRHGLPPGEAWTGGSPYPGLRPFDDEDAGVFFGRSRAAADLLGALRRQLEHGRPFVLVSGASGCGKTSLVRAAVTPLLCQAAGFDGLLAMSSAYCDLGACVGGDLLARVAEALCQWSLDGRPVFLAAEIPELMEALRGPADTLRARIDSALSRRSPPKAAVPRHACLLLILDHAEAAVATPGMTARDRDDLGAALRTLCACGSVAVIGMTRSDLYPRLIDAVPAIAELKAGEGHIDLLPPHAGEIAQMIRAPAALAGLRFDEDADTHVRLDDVLRDAAALHPDALPLLQQTLRALYEARGDDGLLGFQAYRAFGGLEGALAHRAEAVFASLPSAAQERLDTVLSRLVVPHPDSDAITARRVLLSALGDDPTRALVEAFVRARLFVGGLSGGEPGFGVAHEALLRQWPRAREWTRENRALLQARERLRRASRRWTDDQRRADRLLARGRPLEEAREAARRLASDLGPDERDFLRASERADRRRQWIGKAVIASVLASGCIAGAFGWKAQQARREAEQRRDQAQGLVDFMLGDLADGLRPVGNLKLLDGVGSQALDYLERLPAADMQPRELVNHARALRTIGEVLTNQGRFDAARAAFQRADAVARQARAQSPDSIEALAESGTTAFWLGDYAWRHKDFDAAQLHWQHYRQVAQALVARAPGDPRWMLELSYAFNNLGTLAQGRDRSAEAARLFARSIALKRELLRRSPGDSSLRFELIDSLAWLSSAQQSEGRLAEAADGLHRQIGMLRELLRGDPTADAWRRRLATSLLRRSDLALDRGRLEDARRDAGESVTLLSALTTEQPDNRVWRRDLAHGRAQVGWIDALRGDRGQARRGLEGARRVLAPLLRETEPLPEWRTLDAIVRLRLARIAADDSPLSTAVSESAEAAIAELQARFVEAPDDRLAALALAHARLWRGDRWAATGRNAEARADWERARHLLQGPAGRTHNPAVLDAWVRVLRRLGAEEGVRAPLARLHAAGYRHPDFLAFSAAPRPSAFDSTPSGSSPSGSAPSGSSPSGSSPSHPSPKQVRP
ncbi:nSTAND1 domain-containing NTPase [Agrilutibacter solisilvae]|uniref:Winged helix-turn-helix domain-containing protein n=1 Tax=Agrilutibacter solisilvae TaxID=2763317 RepID=A0A974XZP2_9GAMM|nr:winged helix-turn-helix domain-containing protein [Lysobacter solisilvae]QSX77900.1 winged helix-turn-helix domain-containing protein [Lysobacter solisilvae]